MKLKQIASNVTELQFNDGNFLVLISYETPVATYHIRDNVFTRTNKKWSKTTSKHINQWIMKTMENYTGHKASKIIDVDQECLAPFLDELVK